MKLVVDPAALTELHDAAAFYTLKANADLGLAFVAEFERTANLILANPLIGAVFHGTRRHYNLRRFPYHLSCRRRGASNSRPGTPQAAPWLLDATEVIHRTRSDR